MRKLFHYLIFFIFLSITGVHLKGDQCPRKNISVQKAFKINAIYKDLDLQVTQKNNGLKFIKIRYLKKKTINCGTNTTILETLIEPEVKFNVDRNLNLGQSVNGTQNLYAFIMVGPIRPIPTPSLQLLHWLVMNIPGNDFEKGITFAPYVNPIPIPLLGAYRYVFMIYCQKRYIPLPDLQDIVRIPFAVTPWALENDLTGPIAGNFMFDTSIF